MLRILSVALIASSVTAGAANAASFSVRAPRVGTGNAAHLNTPIAPLNRPAARPPATPHYNAPQAPSANTDLKNNMGTSGTLGNTNGAPAK
jgi:hypothetical protein